MLAVDRLVDSTRGWRRRSQFASVRCYCAFVGYPRSGHSLIGALLNAHPRMAIAHELDAVGLVTRKGYTRNALFSAIFDRDEWWKGRQWKWEGWDYTISGQAQGVRDDIRVVGDKAGGLTSRQLTQDPATFTRLSDAIGTPMRFIHHIRNPFDTIATMARKGQPGVSDLDTAISRYFDQHVRGVRIAKSFAGGDLHDLYHESMLQQPEATMAALCEHLGQTASAEYLRACRERINPSPTQSRHSVTWRKDQLDRVKTLASNVEWLSSYTFD